MTPQSSIALTRKQVREIDRRAIEEYGIAGIVLMENAGRNAADFILHLPRGAGPVAIVCGGGNNGGDGFVIARHLDNAGARVELFLAVDPARLTGDAAVNYRISGEDGGDLRAFDTPERIDAEGTNLAKAAVIVDALLGTGFSGPMRPPFDRVIEAMNQSSGAIVVAVDLPSGLDCDSGKPAIPTVRAAYTVTFVARKMGFDAIGAKGFTGDVVVADIGAPHELIERVARESGGRS
jgi:NAD(P)H-hydrate epimerase